jgi:hypothetical protein
MTGFPVSRFRAIRSPDCKRTTSPRPGRAGTWDGHCRNLEYRDRMSEPEDHVSTAALVAAAMVTVVSGLVLTVSWIVNWPAPVLGAAWFAFLAGLIGFGVVAFIAARRSGTGPFQAFKLAGRTLLQALRMFFP